MSALSRRSPFLLSLLLTTACVAADGSDNPGSQAVVADVSLSQLPQVYKAQMLALERPALVAGDLGTDLQPVAEAFSMDDSELTLVEESDDSLGIHTEVYEQTRNGLEVVNGRLKLSRDRSGKIRTAVGASWGRKALDTNPVVDAGSARALAIAATPGAESGSRGELVYLAPSDSKEILLAWRIVVDGINNDGTPILDEVYVDAKVKRIADRHPQVHSARVRDTHLYQGINNIPLVRTEGTGASGVSDVDAAHDAAGVTYDCIATLFGRDSYNGNGAKLVSIANYRDPQEPNVPMQNAFWNGQFMAYGDGFAVTDVGVHEMGHALTQATGNMVYQNEPGALNEAWSDILSAVCDNYEKGAVSANTWTLGEEMAGGAIRVMSNPTADGISRDHYSTRFQGPQDNGGVHLNSGIANLAFYLLTEGGVHPRGVSDQQVVAIGMADSAQIFYRALSTYMNNTTNFAGARAATELAAIDLFGAGSPQVVSVSEAWFAVGVGDAPPPQPEPAQGETEEDTTDTDDGTGNDSSDNGANDDGPNNGNFENGTVTGGCSLGGPQGTSSASLLLGLALLLAFRRRETQ